MEAINILYDSGLNRPLVIEKPDMCPLCHNGIDPIAISAFCNNKKWNKDDCLQVVYRCTKKECRNIFISYYSAKDYGCGSFEYKHSKPINKKEQNFTDVIKGLSPNFCLIYNQSHSAEQDGLAEICGVGYRKALEFLVKDYLIKKNPEKEEEVKAKLLGSCISEYITSENIKKIARRAVWLGNDETHYVRKWEGKDLHDLKRLIDITIYWMEAEKLTEEAETEMPDGI